MNKTIGNLVLLVFVIFVVGLVTRSYYLSIAAFVGAIILHTLQKRSGKTGSKNNQK